MSTVTSIQFELAVNREIENRLNDLVLRAQGLLDKTKIAVKESLMEPSQLRNLLSVASETESVEVVKNFVLYQMGREKKGRKWSWKIGNMQEFGLEVNAELDSLKKTAEEIVIEAGKKAKEPGEPQKDLVAKVWIRLARLYIGYFTRYFVYFKGAN